VIEDVRGAGPAVDGWAGLSVSGYLTPVPDEIDVYELPVAGAIPAELCGQYVRNGPNPLPGQPSPHWFLGHGMLHGVRLFEGRAVWYRNRWVRTRRLDGYSEFGPDGRRDLTVGSANTHIVEHAGRLLALNEVTLPYEVDTGLNTIGPVDFGGRLGTAMTAHPKLDPDTGELHFFGYSPRPPYLTYHRLDAAGQLTHTSAVDVPAPTMMHDFAITENHIVWLDLSVVFDAALLGRGSPYRWDDGYGARIGVMPKAGGAVRWVEVEPCYAFHVGNAREEADGCIVLDAVRYDRALWQAIWSRISGAGSTPSSAGIAAAAAALSGGSLYQWSLGPAGGSAGEQVIDDRPVEFPTLNDNLIGRRNRYLYAVGGDSVLDGQLVDHRVVKYDVGTGETAEHLLEPGWRAGEAVFVPARQAGREDDGWLLTIITHADLDVPSELLILDATALSESPVARVRLPRRVPAGFHGSWIPDAAGRPRTTHTSEGAS
jgi:carotenoid cleavage dioxygenase-like enzyme